MKPKTRRIDKQTAAPAKKRRVFHRTEDIQKAHSDAGGIGTEVPPLPSIVSARDKRPDDSRGDHVLHITTLVRDCPRAIALRILHDIAPDTTRPTGADRLMWAIGRSVEHHVRQSLIAEIGPENIWGDWNCACRASIKPVYTEEKCPECNQPHVAYRERPILNRETGMVGRPDLVLICGHTSDRKLIVRPVEIKSKETKKFQAMSAPEPSHVLQASFYRRLMEAEGYVVLPPIVFYAAKDYTFVGTVYKQFEVADAPWLEQELDRLTGVAQALQRLREGMRTGVAHNRLYAQFTREMAFNRLGACGHAGTPTASRCPQASVCFSL